MSVEGKALGNQVVAAIERFSDNKEYNGVGWFLLTTWGPGERKRYA